MRILSLCALVTLKHLAQYRFLTAEQLVRLGGSRSTVRSMSNLLKQLHQQHRLSDQAKFGVHPKLGKFKTIHFLSAQGASLLNEIGFDQPIKYPKSKVTLFQQDYFHRLACIDFEISFKQWLKENDFKCLLFERYFDPKPNRRPETEIILNNASRIIPDAVVRYQTNNRAFLFLLEVSLGYDAKRVIEQLYAHIKALEDGSVSQTFKINHGHFVVCLFEQESCMNAVMRHMHKDKRLHPSLKEHFLFAHNLITNTEFMANRWCLWDGLRLAFYRR